VKLDLAKSQSDPWLDNIPPLKDGSLGLRRTRLTFEQSVTYFRRKFPLGFRDQAYIGDGKHTGERAYKWRAHALFAQHLGHDVRNELLRKGEIEELSSRAKTVLHAVNILHVQEKITMRKGLDHHERAHRFFVELFNLLDNELVPNRFVSYFDAANSLALGERRPTWPIATVLPYLADPLRFVYMKPEVTRDMADRLAFDLHYDSRPNWPTYERLITMSGMLLDRLRELGAEDWMDVQSFIYVVGDQVQ